MQIAVEDTATCGKNKNHKAPDVDCSCGFYAYAPESFGRLETDSIYAEVDFYGRVIEYDYGYRAEHQRIMRICIKNRCSVIPCDAPSTRKLWTILENKSSIMAPFCSRHEPRAFDVFKSFSIEEIANQLGTEIVWIEPAPSARDKVRPVMRRITRRFILPAIASSVINAGIGALLSIGHNPAYQAAIYLPLVVGMALGLRELHNKMEGLSNG